MEDKYPKSFDVIGNIALVKYPYDLKSKDKKIHAKKLLKSNPAIKTVLEKVGKFSGRLRKQTTKHLAGEKNKEVLYRENGCAFRFNVDTTYFSPRLSNERNEMSKLIKKNEEVLVMFAGVSPFPIVIAKNSKAKKVYSNEINREANKYGQLNIELNKLKERVELIPGDIKKVTKKLKEQKKKFDVIVMPRPQLKDSFLEQAFELSKKGTRVYYYDFCNKEDTPKIIELVKEKAKESKKNIKILNSKNAGDIAPFRVRFRVDFKVLN